VVNGPAAPFSRRSLALPAPCAAGIVHRLDRYTSGVLLVAKNDDAHRQLAAQFSGRQVEKVYLALVHAK